MKRFFERTTYPETLCILVLFATALSLASFHDFKTKVHLLSSFVQVPQAIKWMYKNRIDKIPLFPTTFGAQIERDMSGACLADETERKLVRFDVTSENLFCVSEDVARHANGFASFV